MAQEERKIPTLREFVKKYGKKVQNYIERDMNPVRIFDKPASSSGTTSYFQKKYIEVLGKNGQSKRIHLAPLPESGSDSDEEEITEEQTRPFVIGQGRNGRLIITDLDSNSDSDSDSEDRDNLRPINGFK